MTSTKAHILVIDDDLVIRSLLEKYLNKNGFIAFSADSSSGGFELMKKFIFDLVVVDYMMPEESGIEFIKKVRNSKSSTIPIIMLTALGEVEYRIKGLSIGADDYMAKPFEPKELILRINNILSRINSKNENTVFGDYKFDQQKNELYKNGEILKLTTTELGLFTLLFEHRGEIIGRDEIAKVFNSISERSIDVQVTRLRQKLETDPKNPKYLKTIRNKGYLLNV